MPAIPIPRRRALGRRCFRNITEAIYAWEDGQIDLRQPIDIAWSTTSSTSKRYGFAAAHTGITTTQASLGSANV